MIITISGVTIVNHGLIKFMHKYLVDAYLMDCVVDAYPMDCVIGKKDVLSWNRNMKPNF